MSPGDPAWAKGRFRICLKKQEGFVSVSVLYILHTGIPHLGGIFRFSFRHKGKYKYWDEWWRGVAKERSMWRTGKAKRKSVTESWWGRVSSLHFKVKKKQNNVSTWQPCVMKSVWAENGMRSTKANCQTTATTPAAKPVNNTSMTIWKARGLGTPSECWVSASNKSLCLTWLCFWLSLTTARRLWFC